ncbi:helix-turn-helix domain-containing protein [Mammaliicoccus vitulinus]|uniref:helix-turn-helix domain-containing protein n=1 Tax=Mammaliicoccus vitulinus TaxID=71237 RepID=UPI0002F178A0|nr:helix-turn-helix domain-containing protein [Mammaliicoccus vitulinus]
MFLTVKETATLLRISDRYAYQLVRENKLPHVRLGKKILIDKTSLVEHLQNIEEETFNKEVR